MSKKTVLTIGIIIAVFVGFIGLSMWQSSQFAKLEEDKTGDSDMYSLQQVKDDFAKIDYSKYNLNTILSNNPDAGNLPENITGSADAPVVIYEYADYQCSYCALMNPYINQIVSEFDGKVAVVFRTFILDYHPNGVIGASAANAAAIQGYWKEYKNLLFNNQNEWFYSQGDQLQKQLEDYFLVASGNKGDLTKFRQDMQSVEVAQKVAFDMGAGDYVEIGGTPWFYLDGEWIDNEGMSPEKYANKIRQLIEEKLK